MSRSQLIQALWSEHRSALQAFFRRRTGSGGDAADLTQEVYLRLLRVDETREIASPEAYLFTVARNLLAEQAVMARRQAQRLTLQDAAITELLASEPDPGREFDHEARVRVLRESMAELPDAQKAALIMAYRDEMSYAQIAGKLNVHRSMVGKYVLQALNTCRRRLKREGLA
jgi:RNA polymerase sigma-70 factor (ECF subfamily)